MKLSTSPCMNSATFWMLGVSASPIEVTSTSMELLSFSRKPPKPLIIVCAISSVVPAQVRKDLSKASTSSDAVLINASYGAIWFLTNMADAAEKMGAATDIAPERLSTSSAELLQAAANTSA